MSRRTPRLRAMLAAACVLALAAPLAACGKKGSLDAPPGETVAWPRHYPSKRPVVPPADAEQQNSQQDRR